MSKNAVNAPIAVPRRSSSTSPTTISASDGNSIEKPTPTISAPASATPSECAAAITASPSASSSPAAVAVGRGPDTVGDAAQHEPAREHGDGERGEHGRAAADAPGLQRQHDEPGERRVADVGQRERETRAVGGARQQGFALLARGQRRGLGSGSRIATSVAAAGSAAVRIHTAS